jgi:hypothetical protein
VAILTYHGSSRPLLWHDKDYNGSRFNVLVEWENGEIMTEPLLVIAANDPVTCAVYAREHDLLDIKGWKSFQNLAKHEKHFLPLVKQAKMKSYRQSPKYKFRYRIPKDYEEALKLIELNQNTKWEDATITEMSQLKEYECFIDAGIYGQDKPPDGHKKIRAHLVFGVKHGGCHKALYVAGAHLMAADPNARNLRLDPINDELPEDIWSLRKASPASDHGEDFSLHSMVPTDEHPYVESTPDPSERPGDNTVIVDPQELLGCTFLMDTQKDSQGSTPTLSNAFQTTSPTSAVQMIMSSFGFPSMRTSTRRSSHTMN